MWTEHAWWWATAEASAWGGRGEAWTNTCLPQGTGDGPKKALLTEAGW